MSPHFKDKATDPIWSLDPGIVLGYTHFTSVNKAFHNVTRSEVPVPSETASLDTAALRAAFLADTLFVPGEVNLVITGMDRLALGSAMPQSTPLRLPPCKELRQAYFTERRELGIINLGETGHVSANGQRFSLDYRDALYIGAGHQEIQFEPYNCSNPCFYFLSCPAHQNLPVALIRHTDTRPELLGDRANASRRTLRKYIYPGGVASCQLVMGLTEMEAGSVWNTMPPHSHERRSEVYLYTGLQAGSAVVHLMGEPNQTRHLIVFDRQAVLSPSWSLHAGAGTGQYSFVWGMAGENQSFSDMDPIHIQQLR